MKREAATREQGINSKLATVGWTVTPRQPAYSFTSPPTAVVEQWSTIAGPADHALTDDGTVRGGVEAKKIAGRVP